MNGLNQIEKKMRSRFEERESYLHKHAKLVLIKWLVKFPERFGIMDMVSVRSEECFAESGIVKFKPDITVYDSDGLICIYEICHKSPLTGYRLSMMQYYFYKNEMSPIIFEIDATYVMKQIKCPQKIKMQRFEL